MNYFAYISVFLTAFAAAFFQAWFGVFRDLIGAQFDLLPPLVVYAGLTMNIWSAAALAVLSGLWIDSLSSNPLGVSVLPLFLTALIAHECRDVLLRRNAFAQMIIGGVASALCPCLTLFLILNLGRNPLLGWLSAWQLAVLTVSGGLLTPACFLLFERVNRSLDYQPVVEGGFRADRELVRGRFSTSQSKEEAGGRQMERGRH